MAAGAIFGASGLTLSAGESLVFATEFGHEGGCDGRLSVINVNPASADYGGKAILLEGLCGAHDLKLNAAESLIYFVEVDASRMSVIKINTDKLDWK